eukprot:SAG31_NODE_3749_length_3922_cov_1.586144_7_plen_88_part_00
MRQGETRGYRSSAAMVLASTTSWRLRAAVATAAAEDVVRPRSLQLIVLIDGATSHACSAALHTGHTARTPQALTPGAHTPPGADRAL